MTSHGTGDSPLEGSEQPPARVTGVALGQLGQTARDIVFSLLRRWTNLADPPFLPERSDDVFAPLSPRDRPFAFDLITGIIRWRMTS